MRVHFLIACPPVYAVILRYFSLLAVWEGAAAQSSAQDWSHSEMLLLAVNNASSVRF